MGKNDRTYQTLRDFPNVSVQVIGNTVHMLHSSGLWRDIILFTYWDDAECRAEIESVARGMCADVARSERIVAEMLYDPN